MKKKLLLIIAFILATTVIVYFITMLINICIGVKINNQPVTRKVLIESYDNKNSYDVLILDEMVYLLDGNGIKLYKGDSETSSYLFEFNDKLIEKLVPYRFEFYDDKFYIVFKNELEMLELKSFTNAGELVKEYKALDNIKSFNFLYSFIINETNAYFTIRTGSENLKLNLYIHNLENDTIEKTEHSIRFIDNYKNNKLIFSTSDNKIGLFNPKNKEIEIIYTNDVLSYSDMTYDFDSDMLYALCKQENKFALTKIDLNKQTYEFIRNISERFYTYSNMTKIKDGKIAIILGQAELVIYENIYGFWGKKLDTLKVLFYTYTNSDDFAIAKTVFYNIHEEALNKLANEKGYGYWEMEMDSVYINPDQEIPTIDIDKKLNDGNYDLVFFENSLATAVSDTNVFAYLSTVKTIKEQFSKMLPGIEGLCTFNDRLIGVPVVFKIEGIKLNREKILASGNELPNYDWTMVDYYNYAKEIKNDEKNLLISHNYITYIIHSVLGDLMEGIIIPKDEFETFLLTFKELFSKSLFDESMRSEGGYALSSTSLSSTSSYGDNERTLVPYPIYAKSGRYSAEMSLLVVNKNSDKLSESLEYLSAFIDEKVIFNAHSGTNLRLGDRIYAKYYPIWYKNEKLWALDSHLEVYEYILGKSSKKQLSIDSLTYSSFYNIIKEFAENIIDIETAMERINALVMEN